MCDANLDQDITHIIRNDNGSGGNKPITLVPNSEWEIELNLPFSISIHNCKSNVAAAMGL